MQVIAPKFRRGTTQEFVIERLKELRKTLKRDDYDRHIFTDAIELLQAVQERDEVSQLFRLWEMQDPRG